MYKIHEGHCKLIIASCDSEKGLDFVEKAFNEMEFFVSGIVT